MWRSVKGSRGSVRLRRRALPGVSPLIGRLPSAALVAGLFSLGCSGGDASGADPFGVRGLDGVTEEEARALSAPADLGDAQQSLSAHVVVSRTQSADAEAAQAMAHFAVTSGDASLTLVAAGLTSPVPGVATCERPHDVAAASFTGFVELLLLDVGEVTITPLGTSGGLDEAPHVSLAPHAFPSISRFASGMMYASRDRDASSLPSAVTYRLAVGGSQELGAFRLEASAPAQLSEVTLAGESVSRLERVTAGEPLDVTWDVGQTGDVVVVELSADRDAALTVRCAFADELGAGSISAELTSGFSGAGQVALHRVRDLRAPLSSVLADRGVRSDGELHLRFDFETSVPVEFR